MSLFQTQYPNNTRVVSDTPAIYKDDVVLLCDTSSNAVTIDLLEIPDNYWNTTWKLYVVDNSSNASVNNITINAGSGQTINNQASITLSSDNSAVIIRIASNNQFLAESLDATLTNFTVTDTNTIDLTLTGSPVYNLSAEITDTGWVDLLGFNWYGINNQNAKRVPQCRRVGNIVYFRGTIMIPLKDGSKGDIPLEWDYKGTSPLTDTYFGNTTVAPSVTGPGSVVLNTGGSVTFNQGLAVVPNSVVPNNLNFDNTYSLGFKLAMRLVRISTSPLWSGALNTLFRPFITSDKKLGLILIKDYEESAGTGGTPSNPYSTSVANNLISHVRSGEYIPKYQNVGSVMASSPTSGIQNVKLDYDSSISYEFNCNPNDENEVGGFGWVDLDGLTAFVQKS